MKDGGLKLLDECTYPLTGTKVVSKLFTDIAFIEFTEEGPLLREIAMGLDARDIQRVSGPRLRVADTLGTLERETKT